MAQQVQAGLKLIATMDGTSINGYLRVENTPLIQRYNDAGAFTPDFETLADNKKPAIVPILVPIIILESGMRTIIRIMKGKERRMFTILDRTL